MTAERWVRVERSDGVVDTVELQEGEHVRGLLQGTTAVRVGTAPERGDFKTRVYWPMEKVMRVTVNDDNYTFTEYA